MNEKSIIQSVKEAEVMGPSPFSGNRTPRWVWAWLLAIVAAVILYIARRVLGPFVIAAIFAYIFSPIIDNIQERLKWPRGLVVALFYVIVLGALGIGIYFGA